VEFGRGFRQQIRSDQIRKCIVEPLGWVSGGNAGGVWASPPVGAISGDRCQHFNALKRRHRGELLIQHLPEEVAQFVDGDAAEQLSGECPVFKHQGIEQATIGSGIRTLLLPLADPIFNGIDDHDLSGVDGFQVQAVEFGTSHWNLCGFRWMG